MTTVLGGLLNTHSAIAFTDMQSGFTITGGSFTGASNGRVAFSMPRDGTITSLSAFFTNTIAVGAVGTTLTITAQLYQSTTPDNTFTAVPGALVTLTPAITGIVAIGGTFSGVATGLNIDVTAGTRLTLVFSATVTAGADIATTVTGFASGGVAIS